MFFYNKNHDFLFTLPMYQISDVLLRSYLMVQSKVDFYPNALTVLSTKVLFQKPNQTERQLAFIYPFTALGDQFLRLLLICVCVYEGT